MNKTKKGTLTLDEDDYHQLRAKLILMRSYSVSAWVRKVMKKFLAENPEELMNEILTVIVGSQAHGLANKNSDFDSRGVFANQRDIADRWLNR